MFHRLRTALALLLLTLLSPAAQGVLTLEDFNHWQLYNGWHIQVITFPGIRSFARSDVLTVMATEKPTWLRRYVRLGSRSQFFADDFAADLFRIEHFYAREGFPRATARGTLLPRERFREVVLKIEIDEGPPLILEGWDIVFGSDSGTHVDSVRWSQLLPIRIGERLAESQVQTAADTLAYKLRENGHARARVEYRVTADTLRNTAHVTFVLYPRNHCWIGQTRFTGLKQLSEGTARRELTYRELKPYSPAKLEATRKRLIRLEAFTYVSVKADTALPGDTLTIRIQVEEGNRYRARLGVGYDTEERSRASAEFTDLNFFGRARRFTWSGSIAEIRRFTEARLFWPHTPWNTTDITLAPKWELQIEKAYRLETYSQTTILSAAPLDNVSTSLSNEVGSVRRRDKFRRDSTAAGADSFAVSTYTKSVETFSVGWDTRDNPLISRKGHFIGLTLAESGALYRTDLRWWRAILTARALVPATRFTTLAVKSEFGIMGPLHNSKLTPAEERFYLGGPSSVRGWGRNDLAPRAAEDRDKPIGGDVSFYVTAEVRQNIWGPVTLAVFADAGNVWANPEAFRPLNLYPSAGAGLMFFTPVGPMRLDYARQLRANPFDDRKHWALHFSLGAPF